MVECDNALMNFCQGINEEGVSCGRRNKLIS